MIVPIYIYFIVLSILASLTIILYPPDRLYLKLFPFFLFATFIIELISSYLSSYNKTNIQLYNFFGIFEIVFYFFLLSEVIKNRKIRKIVKGLIWIYPLICMLNIFFVQVNSFHTMTYVLGCLLMVSICIYYFFELFHLSHSISLMHEPSFWICSGLLFFYCCSFPIFGLLNYVRGLPMYIIGNITGILNLMNVLLYSLLTIAFLCRIRIRKSML